MLQLQKLFQIISSIFINFPSIFTTFIAIFPSQKPKYVFVYIRKRKFRLGPLVIGTDLFSFLPLAERGGDSVSPCRGSIKALASSGPATSFHSRLTPSPVRAVLRRRVATAVAAHRSLLERRSPEPSVAVLPCAAPPRPPSRVAIYAVSHAGLLCSTPPKHRAQPHELAAPAAVSMSVRPPLWRDRLRASSCRPP
jgi:hypothetical protein